MEKIINDLIGATAGNPDLIEWAENNLGYRFFLFVGVDPNNPPGGAYYPLIAITEIRISGGGAGPRINYEIDMAVGLKNESVSFDEGNKTYIYEGLAQVDAFRARVFSALYLAPFGKISIKEGAVGQSAVHPLYISGMTMEIEYINTKRRV